MYLFKQQQQQQQYEKEKQEYDEKFNFNQLPGTFSMALIDEIRIFTFFSKYWQHRALTVVVMSHLIPGHNHDFVFLGTSQPETIIRNIWPAKSLHSPYAAIGRQPLCSRLPVVNRELRDWAAVVYGFVPWQLSTATTWFRIDVQRGWYICDTIYTVK